MKKTVEDVRNEFIDTIGEASERFGMARIAGLLKGLLLVSREPISLDEMAQRLEVSKASVSTNIRLLERWRAVRRVFNRNDRKNYYELRGDLWDIETEIVSTIIREEMDKFSRRVAEWRAILAEADADEDGDREFLQERLTEIEDYLDAVTYFLNLLVRDGKVTPQKIRKIEIT